MSAVWSVAAVLLEALRARLARVGQSSSRKKRSVIVLLLALVLIPVWQARLVDPGKADIKDTYATRASTGLHSEPKFFFFMRHLGLYPLMTFSVPREDTKEEAARILREHPDSLAVDEYVTFRSGDRGRTYLYWVDWYVHHRTLSPSLTWANALGFMIALCGLYAGFWWIRRPIFGAVIVVFLGSNPFQLYAAYRQENVFAWAITTALAIMALHIPLMVPRVSEARWVWGIPVVAGAILASSRTIRSEGVLIAASAILVYLTMARTPWTKRATLAVMFSVTLSLGTSGYAKFFRWKFTEAQRAMVAAGGEPYTGPLQMYHEVWHTIYCGLGDYDKKYGYEWEDRKAYAYAYPILKEKYGLKWTWEGSPQYVYNEKWDAKGKYHIFFSEAPHYHDIIRDKLLHDIRRDPVWYLDILYQRAKRVLRETAPLSVHIGKEPVLMTSALLGYLCIPLAVFLALMRRWTDLKLLLFTVPLSAPALLIYSDKGMAFYSTYHFFGAALMLALMAEGARAWLRRGPAKSIRPA